MGRVRHICTGETNGVRCNDVPAQMGLGHDEGHGHNDLGSYQIWRNGRWLSRESTGYAGAWTDVVLRYGGGGTVDPNNAAAHNTLLINGTGGTVRHESPTGSYVMRRLESRPEYAFGAVDLSSAYSGRANRVIREYIFVRGLETMVIFDRLDSSSTKTFLAHFEQNPSVDSGSRVVNAANGNQVLRLNTVWPTNASYRLLNEGGAIGQYRLEVDSSGSTQSYFLHTLQAKGAADPVLTPSVTDNGPSFTLTLDHPSRGTVTIVLQKGMSSNGGSVNGIPLFEGMQETSINENGPVWGSGHSSSDAADERPHYSLKRTTLTQATFGSTLLALGRWRTATASSSPRRWSEVSEATALEVCRALAAALSSEGTARTVCPAPAA